MPRRVTDPLGQNLSNLFDLLADGDLGFPMRVHLDRLRTIRDQSPDRADDIDAAMLDEIGRVGRGLRSAARHHRELEEQLERLAAPPWHTAVFLGIEALAGQQAAVVASPGEPARVVRVGDQAAIDALAVGDGVYLNGERSLLLGRLERPAILNRTTAEVRRVLADGACVLRSRDEEVIARLSGRVEAATLAPGDTVVWNALLGLVLQKIERGDAPQWFLTETPGESFADIGGLDEPLERLQRSLQAHLFHGELAERYRLRRLSSVLLVGPPGTGKTLVARALANWVGRHAPAGRARFMHLKPGALHSSWYSETEANYRAAFQAARTAAADAPGVPVVMFFDEVDAIGATRQGGATRIDDRVLTAFMTELDGLEARGNIIVVAATNRREALDPALLRPGRLGDLVLDIPRPGRRAALAILERHLPAGIPYAVPGPDAVHPRERLMAMMVSRLYAPNGEGPLATVVFRDGTRRPVLPRDLVSGASLANMARTAIEQACLREVGGGMPGVSDGDVLDAIDHELHALVSALTPANCHHHLTDLPQDLAVVRVEPIPRSPRSPHNYLVA